MASAIAERWTVLDEFIEGCRLRTVARYVPDRGNVIVDLGCGDGRFLSTVKDRFNLCIGVDQTERSSCIFDGIKMVYIKSNLNDTVVLGNRIADVVVSMATIEHLENPETFVTEIYRILTPGGTAILTTPAPAAKPVLNLLSRLRIISRADVADHKRYFNNEEIRKMFHMFSNVSIKGFQSGLNQIVVAWK
ncbi:MAG: class I SAM-dependent methyltransferase [Candidatus Aenigmatarchaeota archaeon]